MTAPNEIETKALELLAISAAPLGDGFDPIFQRLVGLGLAQRTDKVWAITEAGCDYLAQHVASSSVPNGKAPCGFTRLTD